MIDPVASERFMAAPWLVETDRETKQVILDSLVETRAPAGAILLEQGQPNDHLTFLIEGTAEIERAFGNGRRERITTLTSPAVFGTTSFFQPKPPTVTVRATSDVWMLSLYQDAYQALRRSHPRAAEVLSLAVLRAMSERFDLIDQLFSDYMAHHPDESASRMTEWAGFRSRLFDDRGI